MLPKNLSIHFLIQYFCVIFLCQHTVLCSAITNSFNAELRDYTFKDAINSTNIKTLQKEEPQKYTGFVPVQNPVKFKDFPDSATSSSSYSRGLLHHDYPGYGPHEYEESSHFDHEFDHPTYGFDHHDVHHGYDDHHHFSEHHNGHHDGHHLSYGHHKHYDHALAAKTILWPIAGIALLGAAAALVSNPVLLQLGVISGRRKRETKIEEANPELLKILPQIKKQDYTIVKTSNEVKKKEELKKRDMKKTFLSKIVQATKISSKETNILNKPRKQLVDDNKYVPIPLIYYENMKTNI